MKHPSPRLLVAAMSVTLLGGSAATAAAATAEPEGKQRVICVINQDDSTSEQHGVCVILPHPTLP